MILRVFAHLALNLIGVCSMMTNRERMDFVIWAGPRFPGFTTNYQQARLAEIGWDLEKRLRVLTQGTNKVDNRS